MPTEGTVTGHWEVVSKPGDRSPIRPGFQATLQRMHYNMAESLQHQLINRLLSNVCPDCKAKGSPVVPNDYKRGQSHYSKDSKGDVTPAIWAVQSS